METSPSSSSSGPHENDNKDHKKVVVSLLDYGAGNVCSVRNAILATGHTVVDISSPDELETAEAVVFPGVGAFGTAMERLHAGGYVDALRRYVTSDRPFLGICLGMQTLFEGSEESSSSSSSSPILEGLGIIPGHVQKFRGDDDLKVPHIGWNGLAGSLEFCNSSSSSSSFCEEKQFYFVHSYFAPLTNENSEWVATTTTYGGQRFVSSVHKGQVVATQFHPEKSGGAGLEVLRGFLNAVATGTLVRRTSLDSDHATATATTVTTKTTTLVKRVVVALDVRTDDQGKLVVTKGDQYDVREKTSSQQVRNLGLPQQLAETYYHGGADELCFLNITSFRAPVLDDLPMLAILEDASRKLFVPLTVGGGIRAYTEANGVRRSALEVASRYFRAGADKVSIGSDAVYAAEEYYASGQQLSGTTSIEEISKVYGAQAVVVSVDPKRVYLDDNDNDNDKFQTKTVVTLDDGRRCWYQCTTSGGRTLRDLCAVAMCRACEALGAGELMLNCIDQDGQCSGFDHALIRAVGTAVTIPVIASSGAGHPSHFSDVFQQTDVAAALAAGMFHRREYTIAQVKQHLRDTGVPVREV